MKYIRTKNGIYKSKKKELERDCLVIGEKENGKLGLVRKDIIAQSDTIEELCDEYILVAPYRFRKPKTATELEKDFEEMKSFYTDKDDTIYGAIWTDKGLIYVAKMNEKGELELL